MRIDHDEDESGRGCPHMAMTPCAKKACSFYIKLAGINPNTGEPVDGWQCATVWNVLLQVENNKMTHQQGASIESFRNETAKGALLIKQEVEDAAKLGHKPAPLTIIEG